MQNDLFQREIQLLSGHPLRLESGHGVVISCVSGTLWITISGESGDIFLRPGQQYRLVSNRLTLVEAMSAGSLQLLPAPGRVTLLLVWASCCRRRFKALGQFVFVDRINRTGPVPSAKDYRA